MYQKKVLISSLAIPEKQAGVKASASGNYSEAVSKLEAALKSDRNQAVQLVTIQCGKGSGFGYEFVPLPK